MKNERTAYVFYNKSIAERIDAAMEQCHIQLTAVRDLHPRSRTMVIDKSKFTGLFNLSSPVDIVAEIKALKEHFEKCEQPSGEYCNLTNSIYVLVHIAKSFQNNMLIDGYHVMLTCSLIDFVLKAGVSDDLLRTCRQIYQDHDANAFEIVRQLTQLYIQGNVDAEGNVIKLPNWLVKELVTTITKMAQYNNISYTDAKALIEFFNGIVEQ